MKNLVEQSQKININTLVKDVKSKLAEVELNDRVDALGQQIVITTSQCNFGGQRFWFMCPLCQKRVGTLYKIPTSDNLLCRKCHDLSYLKSRFHKML